MRCNRPKALLHIIINIFEIYAHVILGQLSLRSHDHAFILDDRDTINHCKWNILPDCTFNYWDIFSSELFKSVCAWSIIIWFLNLKLKWEPGNRHFRRISFRKIVSFQGQIVRERGRIIPLGKHVLAAVEKRACCNNFLWTCYWKEVSKQEFYFRVVLDYSWAGQ